MFAETLKEMKEELKKEYTLTNSETQMKGENVIMNDSVKNNDNEKIYKSNTTKEIISPGYEREEKYKENPMLNEKEKFIVSYLRNPLIYVNRKDIEMVVHLIDELSNDEIIALYEKMDKYIEEEGHQRKELGSYDEMYVLELLTVKDRLQKEIEKRNIV